MRFKKIVFTKPGTIEVASVELEFGELSPTEIVVRNLYSLVSAGTELACLAGTESWFPLPGTPGYASVGEVVARGATVTKVDLGDKVFTHGPHSGYFKIDISDRFFGICVKVPLGLRADHALFARMGTIAMTSLRVSNIELGDVVLVIGLGQIGNLAAQLCALQGARVIGVDLSEHRRQWARECHVAAVFDATDPNWKKSVCEVAANRGVTTAIDATGNAQVVTEIVPLVAPYGEIILLGTPRVPFQTNITEVYSRIHLATSVTFKGALEWRFPTFNDLFVKHSVERNTEILLELIAEMRISVSPFYTHKVPPEIAKEVYAGLRDKKDEYAGVVFDWTADSKATS
jgi:2-desacetyl-2-hydroxyethyl bacteriochlorophyllide A dehydrogenase